MTIVMTVMIRLNDVKYEHDDDNESNDKGNDAKNDDDDDSDNKA